MQEIDVSFMGFLNVLLVKVKRVVVPHYSVFLKFGGGVTQNMEPKSFGQYEIEQFLGEGGVGKVYRGSRSKDGQSQPVAIKFLHKEVLKKRDLSLSLISEAKIVSLLNHPNIVKVFELGEHDESLFMAMELVEGFTLDDVLALNDGPIPINIAVSIFFEIAAALSYIHAFHFKGQDVTIIHCDMSLQNIMINATTFVSKLNDFGFSKVTERNKSVSVSHPIVGNPYFISPEHIRGQWVDQRSDIYSLGIVFYDLLLSNRDYTWDIKTVARRAHRGETVDRSAMGFLPETIQKILGKMLEPVPDNRYQSTKELLVDLKALLPELPGYNHVNIEKRAFFSELMRMAKESAEFPLLARVQTPNTMAVRSISALMEEVESLAQEADAEPDEADSPAQKTKFGALQLDRNAIARKKALRGRGLPCGFRRRRSGHSVFIHDGKVQEKGDARMARPTSTPSSVEMAGGNNSARLSRSLTSMTVEAETGKPRKNRKMLLSLVSGAIVIGLLAAAWFFVGNREPPFAVGGFPPKADSVPANPVEQPPRQTPLPVTEDHTAAPSPEEPALQVPPKVEKATLKVRVIPFGRLKVTPLQDGVLREQASRRFGFAPPQGVRLDPGTYRVTVSHPKLGQNSYTVTLKEGESKQIQHRFQ